MNDRELVAAAKRGDQVALAKLLQANYLVVKKYLITVTFDRTLAEDLTQETMIRAIQRIGQFSGRAKFSTWLISIATNLFMDDLRRQKRQQRLQAEQSRDILTNQTHPEVEPQWKELLQRLQELPRDVSLPLVLKHYYGYTYKEIAQWMDIPVGTVKSRIFNGIRSLRKGLKAYEPG